MPYHCRVKRMGSWHRRQTMRQLEEGNMCLTQPDRLERNKTFSCGCSELVTNAHGFREPIHGASQTVLTPILRIGVSLFAIIGTPCVSLFTIPNGFHLLFRISVILQID